VVVFEEDTPIRVIEGIRPDILIKGGDYTVETVVGSDETKAFLAKFGGDQLMETPEAGQARLLKDVDSWKTYIEVAKITPQG